MALCGTQTSEQQWRRPQGNEKQQESSVNKHELNMEPLKNKHANMIYFK